MGLNRRSFLRRTATVVGTLGAAGSAETWARDIKTQEVPKPKPYKGYEEDLLELTLEIEKRSNIVLDDWPEEPQGVGPRYSALSDPHPAWEEYDKAYARAYERQCEASGIWHEFGWVAPVGSAGVADAMGRLEQDEAKPVLIVSSPTDFSDFRKMASDPEVTMVYDEGPIRCRIFTIPVVTSTKIDRGTILVAGLKVDGTLRMARISITR